MNSMQRLLRVMTALRDPDRGCPWDLEQTFRSIVPHTLEEAYEVADAIERDDMTDLRDELGDLLFHVVFYAQLAREAGSFDFEGVASGIAEKMVRRHPHVFGNVEERSVESQMRSWEAIKAEERRDKAADTAASAMDDVPVALPGLARAVKIQRRAARVGFDWRDAAPVFDKVREELEELETEVEAGESYDALEDELGDVLFACANLARHLGVDPDQALRRSNRKFERRFRRLEQLVREQGGDPGEAAFDVLENAYQIAKAEDKTGPGGGSSRTGEM